jgi:hypothetical protein
MEEENNADSWEDTPLDNFVIKKTELSHQSTISHNSSFGLPNREEEKIETDLPLILVNWTKLSQGKITASNGILNDETVKRWNLIYLICSAVQSIPRKNHKQFRKGSYNTI